MRFRSYGLLCPFFLKQLYASESKRSLKWGWGLTGGDDNRVRVLVCFLLSFFFCFELFCVLQFISGLWLVFCISVDAMDMTWCVWLCCESFSTGRAMVWSWRTTLVEDEDDGGAGWFAMMKSGMNLLMNMILWFEIRYQRIVLLNMNLGGRMVKNEMDWRLEEIEDWKRWKKMEKNESKVSEDPIYMIFFLNSVRD